MNTQIIHYTIIAELLFFMALCIYLYFAHQKAIAFLQENKVSFFINITSESRLSDAAKNVLKINYDLSSPSYIVVLIYSVFGYTLSRKRFYEDNQIQLFFNPLTEDHPLHGSDSIKSQEYSIYN